MAVYPALFLVATKRLYMSVCPSVRPSVGWLVRHAFVFRPTRSDLWPCIRPCSICWLLSDETTEDPFH